MNPKDLTHIVIPFNYSDNPANDVNAYHDDLARREKIWNRVYLENLVRDDWDNMAADAALSLFDDTPEDLINAVKADDQLEIGRLFMSRLRYEREKYARKCANRASGLEK